MWGEVRESGTLETQPFEKGGVNKSKIGAHTVNRSVGVLRGGGVAGKKMKVNAKKASKREKKLTPKRGQCGLLPNQGHVDKSKGKKMSVKRT